MPVRKTESRIPLNLQPSDLGQAVVASDGRCVLVSFITSPLVVNRENMYVLFVTDQALATAAQSFEWMFAENEGAPETHTTQYGEISYQPKTVGTLNLAVRILDVGNTQLESLTFTQEIRPLNRGLEITILCEQGQAGPAVGNLDVARELVNDHNLYYQSITLQSPEAGDAFHRFVFGLVRNGALQRPPAQRKRQIDQLTASLNGDAYDFPALIAQGLGVCSIRLSLLAMFLPEAADSSNKFLKWTELPESQGKRSLAETQLFQDCAALDESKRLDLFNVVRFPKSNITQCGRIIESLRNRYFPGTNFNDVMTGMSGTRGHWIIKHFRLGPLQRG